MGINVYIPDTIPFDETGYLQGVISDSSTMNNEIISVIISTIVEPKLYDSSIGSLNDATLGLERDKRNWISLKTVPNLEVTGLVINNLTVDLVDIMSIIYSSYDIKESGILQNINGEYIDPIASFAKFYEEIVSNESKNMIIQKWSWLQFLIAGLPLYYKFIFLMESFFEKSDKLFEKMLGMKSCFIRQVLLRIKQIKYLTESKNRPKKDLSICRLFGIVATDIILGILCVYLLFSLTSSCEIHNKVKTTTSILASNVQALLEKLRGAPAGLKLNQPLTEAYANFFSYIVHLWTIYLDRANSAMAVVSYFFMFVGVLGLSTQAALMADVFNLVSLHIYCVYVYAARIHMVQVSIVGSQWRAFCGKKWNPLKKRSDGLDEFSRRPLRKILTVFVFTVVVFLFPTTTVYYAVFTLMRLCFVCMNGLITLFIWSLNYNPIFVFVQYLISSPKIKGKIHFETMLMDSPNTKVLPFLKMYLQPSSLGKIISFSNETLTIPSFPSPNLNSLYSTLIYADCLL